VTGIPAQVPSVRLTVPERLQPWLVVLAGVLAVGAFAPFGYYPLVFIAQGIGFASIKGLIEHAMALDIAEKIYLFWFADGDEPHYLNNLCRAWNDALDNFEYRSLEKNDSDHPEDVIMAALDSDDPAGFDYYLCTDEPLHTRIEAFLEARSVPKSQFLYEKI